MMYRVSLLIVGLLLAGCQEEEIHTVQHYLDNETERTERLKTCEAQDRASEDANCVNARDALTLAAVKASKQSWDAQIEAEQPAPAPVTE